MPRQSLISLPQNFLQIKNRYNLLFQWPTTSTDLDEIDLDNISDDRWTLSAQRPNDEDLCLRTRPTNSDIIKRFRAILP